jgi:hypothetical protein
MTYLRSAISLLLALLSLLVLGVVSLAQAAPCGGTTACSCGDTLTEPRTLTDEDPVTTTVCTTDVALFVHADLDLGGRTVRGDGRAGTVGLEVRSVTVQHGSVAGFGRGVQGLEAFGVHLTGLQITANGTGIWIDGGQALVEKNLVRRNGLGINVKGDNQGPDTAHVVRLNRIEDNTGNGLQTDGVGDVVTRNVVLRNEGVGITVVVNRIVALSDTIVSLNQAKYSGRQGFVLIGPRLRVSRNIAVANGDGTPPATFDGFHVGSDQNTLDANRSSYNTGFGIRDVSGGNAYARNVCVGNGLGKSSPAGLCR